MTSIDPPPDTKAGPGSLRLRKGGGLSLLIAIVGLLLFAIIGSGLYFAFRPVTVRIAVGPAGSDDVKVIQALAQMFTRQRNAVRLQPVVTDGASESIDLLTKSSADMAVVRADLALPADAQTVAVLRKNVVVLWSAAPPKGAKKPAAVRIKDLSDLPGHRVGIIGRTQANVTLFNVILKESGIATDKIDIVQFPVGSVADMVKDPTLSEFMAVGPLDS